MKNKQKGLNFWYYSIILLPMITAYAVALVSIAGLFVRVLSLNPTSILFFMNFVFALIGLIWVSVPVFKWVMRNYLWFLAATGLLPRESFKKYVYDFK